MAWIGRSGHAPARLQGGKHRLTSPPRRLPRAGAAGPAPGEAELPARAVRAGALGAALLFAVHPLRVEPVSWLSARGDLVAGLAAFLAVTAYLRGTRVGYWASVILFAVALMGKSMVVTLPLVLLVLDVYPLRRLGPAAGGWWGAAARRVYLEKLPFLVLSAAAAVLAVLARIEFGSLVEVAEVGWGARLAASVYALAFPLWKWSWPEPLAALFLRAVCRCPGPRPRRFVVAGSQPSSSRRSAAGPPWRRYGVVRDVMRCRFRGSSRTARISRRSLYLPGRRAGALAGGGLSWCATQVMARAPRAAFARGVLGLAVAVTLVLVSASAWQALIWHNSVTLWSRVVKLEPDGAIARTGLGTALLADGRPLEAAAHYRRALEIFPRCPRPPWGWLDFCRSGPARGGADAWRLAWPGSHSARVPDGDRRSLWLADRARSRSTRAPTAPGSPPPPRSPYLTR